MAARQSANLRWMHTIVCSREKTNSLNLPDKNLKRREVMVMRNLIVCYDGTWNTPEQDKAGVPVPINVVRIHNALADIGQVEMNAGDRKIEQLRYYHPSVGAEGNWWEKAMGGAMGFGLDKNIISAYRWLAGNYRQGDRICCFGFSRGASPFTTPN